jgi:pyridoxal biosynthesis lyase PdxS
LSNARYVINRLAVYFGSLISNWQILEAIGVDYIDESEVLTPADHAHHVEKHNFNVPFVCVGSGGINVWNEAITDCLTRDAGTLVKH